MNDSEDKMLCLILIPGLELWLMTEENANMTPIICYVFRCFTASKEWQLLIYVKYSVYVHYIVYKFFHIN